MIIKIFIIGWIILIGALIINVGASAFKLYSWYDFIQLAQRVGIFEAFQQTPPISVVFLFIIYPFLLGLLGYLGFKFMHS